MIAVVTGSSGFIGSHLVDALLARGATVRALVRDGSPADALDPRVERHVVDLVDVRSVRESPAWEGATHAFHLAGVTKRRTLAQFRSGNVVPTANVLAGALARGGSHSPRVILVSSQAAAGPAPGPDRPVREDDPPHPIEAYGQSKLEAEQATRLHPKLPVVIVRPASVYGPRDRDFLRAFRLATLPLAVHAVPPDHVVSIVHVADVVSALLLAADRPEAVGRTYFVANDTPTSWRDLYEEMGRVAGTSPLATARVPLMALRLAGVVGDAVSLLTGWHTLANGNKTMLARPRWWVCDASRARAELGWTQEVPLQRGLRETYLWYRRAGWLRAGGRRTADIPTDEPSKESPQS
jgi:nucleoside-diphosphate-sugar epimerase